MKRHVSTPHAPAPIGPYSQAVCVDGWLFISGQIPIDPRTGEVVHGDFKAQVKRVMENVKAIIEAAGGSMNSVVKVVVYLKDLTRVKEFNEVYSSYFEVSYPARSLVAVSALPRDAEVELDVIAKLPRCPE